MSEYGKGTQCIQGGWQPKNGEARVLPIYQSTTFKYESTEQMGRLFDLEESGYFYTRLQNPTNDCVAQKICDLEGGVAAMLTSSKSQIFCATQSFVGLISRVQVIMLSCLPVYTEVHLIFLRLQ